MRDEHVRRYARHILLDEVGGLGQTALLASSARLASADRASLIAAAFLAAGGVGTIVAASASDTQRAELAAHGPDSRIAADGDGAPVDLEEKPAWWPGAPGDGEALAFWRGGLAAARFMTAIIDRR